MEPKDNSGQQQEQAKDFFQMSAEERDAELAKLSQSFTDEDVTKEPEAETETPEKDTEEVSEQTDTSEETDKQDTDEEEKTDDKPEEEESPEVKAPEKDTAKTDTDEPLIDDALIAKYPAEYKSILEKYKGQPAVTALAKALQNANKLIGKPKVSDLLPDSAAKPAESQQQISKPAQSQLFSPTAKEEEIVTVKNTMIMDHIAANRERLGLSKEFPLPPTLDIRSKEYRDWYKDVLYDHPVDVKIFDDALVRQSRLIDQAYNQLQDLRSTWKEKNDAIIDKDIEFLNDYFKTAGVSLTDYGINLQDEKLLQELLFKNPETKELDPDLFEWVNGEIPILRRGELARKYMEVKGAQTLKDILSNERQRAEKKGAADAKNQIKPVNKGLGTTRHTGKSPDANADVINDPYAAAKAGKIDEYLAGISRKIAAGDAA